MYIKFTHFLLNIYQDFEYVEKVQFHSLPVFMSENTLQKTK
jgi:hypothetical protein